MRTAVIGAGMAGLACAEALVRSGHEVQVFDKGRGPGGRMSTRRVSTEDGEAAFDHGAQYFTVRDPDFAARVADWAGSGVAARWPAAGPDAWVGCPGMNAPVRAMATALPVRWAAQVQQLSRVGGAWALQGEGFEAETFDRVVVAAPAEQAAVLLAEAAPDVAAAAAAVRSEPCWTVMCAFQERVGVAQDILRGEDLTGGPLSWAARNSAKPGRSGLEAWVLQASPEWSTSHLEESREAVLAALLPVLRQHAGGDLPVPVTAQAHRWRYARTTARSSRTAWAAETGIGACGDWLEGPRVEAAWTSGTRLARIISSVTATPDLAQKL